MIRTQIQLTEEQVTYLKQAAAEQNVSMAHIIRESVEQYITSNNLTDKQARRKAALDMIGKYSVNIPDLSDNHDDYLADAYED